MYAFSFADDGAVSVRLLKGLAGRLADPAVVLDDFGIYMKNNSIPATFAAGGRPKAWARSAWTSQAVQMDHGHLLRSVDHEVDGSTLRMGSNLVYARQRQLGGTITARGAKSLVIPLPGTPREKRAKDYGDQLFFLPPKKGDPKSRGVLAREGPGGRPIAMFVLRRSITQPARPFIVFQPDDIQYVGRRLVEYATTGGLQ